MSFGVTNTGFIKKTFEDIKDEISDNLKTSIPGINTDELSVAGRIIGELAKPCADLWDLGEAVYYSHYPSTANGQPLDDVVDIVGIKRLQATKSTSTLTLYGTQGTIVVAGKNVEVTNTKEVFTTLSDITIDSAAAHDVDIGVGSVLNNTLYRVTINGINFDYTSDSDATNLEIIAGLKSAVDAGTEPVSFVDNLDGTANIISIDVDVTFSIVLSAELSLDKLGSPSKAEAVNAGQVVATAGSLVTILTPVAGWDTVTNRLDATVGRDIETDTELRLRREESLQVSGYATPAAIKSRLLQVTDVTGASVFENDSYVIDEDGRPPKSYECIVLGGDDADIAEVLWQSKPAGIEMVGDVSMNVTDSEGNPHIVKFSRPTVIYLWVQVTITKHSEESFPSNGVTEIKQAVVDFGNALEIGNDVITQRFFGSIFEIEGIATVLVEIAATADAVGPPGGYSANNLSVAPTDVAVFDTTRVTVIEL